MSKLYIIIGDNKIDIIDVDYEVDNTGFRLTCPQCDTTKTFCSGLLSIIFNNPMWECTNCGNMFLGG